MARNQATDDEPTVDTRSDEEKAFDKAARVVAARSRDIAKAIKDWRDGDSELDEVILEIQLGQRKLSKAFAAMSAAHKELVGK